MIERREKITLNWRPRGTPARRLDDFAEIPHLAIAPEPQPEPDTRDIGLRLENWARWATTVNGGRVIHASQTGAICERLRREAEGDTSRTGERRHVDEADAMRIERAMRDLDTRNRMLLYWCYIRQAQPDVVCRKMSIAHKPATVFVEQFRAAQRAVECLLDNKPETKP